MPVQILRLRATRGAPDFKSHCIIQISHPLQDAVLEPDNVGYLVYDTAKRTGQQYRPAANLFDKRLNAHKKAAQIALHGLKNLKTDLTDAAALDQIENAQYNHCADKSHDQTGEREFLHTADNAELIGD